VNILYVSEKIQWIKWFRAWTLWICMLFWIKVQFTNEIFSLREIDFILSKWNISIQMKTKDWFNKFHSPFESWRFIQPGFESQLRIQSKQEAKRRKNIQQIWFLNRWTNIKFMHNNLFPFVSCLVEIEEGFGLSVGTEFRYRVISYLNCFANGLIFSW
jgi:hypothetical protein